jgi:DNA-binding transcriptional LysR family regulator
MSSASWGSAGGLLQDWLHRLRRSKPGLAIIAESHTPELLTRGLLDGLLDAAFMSEPAQLEVLQIEEIALLKLVLVSNRSGQSAHEALDGDFVMVDRGLSFALQHRRLYPDAPEPQVRLAKASMAKAFLLELGGATYLPARNVASELESGALHVVGDAPPIDRFAYAVFPVRSARLELIKEVIKRFEYKVRLDHMIES